jgi:regulator of replication initiation timing
MAKNTRALTEEINKMNIDIKDWMDSSEAYRLDYERLRKALQNIIIGSQNKEIGDLEFRVKAAQSAHGVLALLGSRQSQENADG